MWNHLVRFSLLFVVLIETVLGQTHPPFIDPPWNWRISSDYGPRTVDSSPYHRGIDYGSPTNPWVAIEGQPIPSIEAGEIISILQDGQIWTVKVLSDFDPEFRLYIYRHLFYNSRTTNSEEGNWETIEAPCFDQNGQTANQQIIIEWISKSQFRANKILCPVSGLNVQYENHYINDILGNPLSTENHLEEHESLGPVGKSGTMHAHLHLGIDPCSITEHPAARRTNPLYYLTHNPDTNPEISFFLPANEFACNVNDLNSFAINVLINSMGSLDVEKVDFYIQQNIGLPGDPNLNPTEWHLGVNGQVDNNNPTFEYGGDPYTNPSSNMNGNGAFSGVIPSSSEPGYDIFYMTANLDYLDDNTPSLGVGRQAIRGSNRRKSVSG